MDIRRYTCGKDGGLIEQDYFRESIFDLVDPVYIALGIVSTIIIAYYMLVIEAYEDFETAIHSIQLYLIITLIMAVLYLIAWNVAYERMLNIIIRANVLCVLPVGLISAYYQGYSSEVLTDLQWLFTHDMMYYLIVAQVVIVLVWLLGLKDYVVVKRR